MSIPFTSLGPQDANKAGYLRIGNVVLKTPPTDILTNRVSGQQRMTVLRGSNDLIKLTGKGRWDVTVRWIAMLDDTVASTDLTGRYAQWEDLRSIVAMFKVAPFVEIENSYIRQVLCEQDPTVSGCLRMAFGLRQLRIATHSDIVDALDCSLTMTWFNYFPYSNDFGYQNDTDDGAVVSGDADSSAEFGAYLEVWKANNLDKDPNPFYDGPNSTVDYRGQQPGELKLNWREYRTMKTNTAMIVSATPSQAANIGAPTSPRSKAGINSTTKWDPLINKYAAQYGLSPAIVKAIMTVESGCGKAATVGANYQVGGITIAGNSVNATTQYLLQHIQTDADGGAQVVATYSQQNRSRAKSGGLGGPVAPDLGLMQLNFPTAVRFSGQSGLRPVDCFDPDLNIRTGCAYLAYLYGQGMTDQTLGAYNNGSVVHPVQSYSAQVYAVYQKLAVGGGSLATASSATQPGLTATAAANPAATPTTPASQSTSLSGATSIDALLAGLTVDDQITVQKMLDNNWQFDFVTNDLAYFYLTHEVELSDSDNMYSDGSIAMPPRQISVLFVNNLAQIPLASYQYPTYQHVGSPSSEISIGFLSVGKTIGEDAEPSHPGISILGGIISFLEAQYLTYRNNARNPQSIHRFEAVLADNQILNMLGIRGLTLDNLSTETVPDASDLVQVELSAKQFENIFEAVHSFRINSVTAAASNVAKSLINSGALSSLSAPEQKSMPTLSAFAAGRASGSLPALDAYLLQAGQLKGNNLFVLFDNTDVINVPADTAVQMLALIAPTASPVTGFTNPIATTANVAATIAAYNRTTYPNIALRLDWVSSSGQWKAGDLALINALATGPNNQETMAETTAAASSASLLVPSNTARMQAIYDDMYTIMGGTDAEFASEISTLSDSPTFATQFQSAFAESGPALDEMNTKGMFSEHTCYKSMGLNMISPGSDNGPGQYFVDHNEAYQEITRTIIGQVVSDSAKAVNTYNATTTGSEYDQTITNSEFIGENADAYSLVKMVNIPGLSMAEAFPTFKLFLMEDEASGIVNCHDNFYSYASVTDIEVIRFQDKPDMAVVQITNIANLLQHHLYDSTLMGRYEASLDPNQALVPEGGPITGDNPLAAVFAARSLYGQLSQNYADGFIPGQRAPKPIPMQYIALQAGTKIQIRMGYSNNPDKLTPVFTGRVTQINTEDDMMIITAESFLGELCTIPTYSGQPEKARDFGSEWFSCDAGDGVSVVEHFLGADQAKHFGGFQLAQISDPLFTGLTWENRVGKAIGDMSVGTNNTLTRIGAGLAGSRDRSAENLLVNHLINYEGSVTQIRNGQTIQVRAFEDVSSNSYYTKYTYYTQLNSTFTAWDLIRDVSRRYPEYNLICKQYGFPYSADATMLLAHPLDHYFARPPLPSDVELSADSLTNTAEWQNWWQARGQALWDIMVKDITAEAGFFETAASTRAKLDSSYGFKIPSLSTILGTNKNYPTSPGDMSDKMQAYLQGLTTLTGVGSGSANPGLLSYLNYKLNVGLETTLNWLLSVPIKPFGGANLAAQLTSTYKEVQADMRNLQDDWLVWLSKKGPPRPFERLKPVRRYHFIDHNTIVHNGMVVNDKIYNGIKVLEDTFMGNGNIPAHYRRILDVTSLMNDPKRNLPTNPLRGNVAQSFLREEVGKMYDGEIVLRGVPEIEPLDCLVIVDASTAIAGIVEVCKVVHSFSQENGYITIVTPRCLVAINESATAGLSRMMQMVMAKTIATANGLLVGGGLSQAWASLGKIPSGQGLAEVGIGAAVGGIAALVYMGGLPALTAAVVIGTVCMLGGVLVTGLNNEKGNIIQVMPVTRWARPWVGGLQGYMISDMWQNLGSAYTGWIADNIYPLIDLYRISIGAPTDWSAQVLSSGTPPAVPAGSTPALNPPANNNNPSPFGTNGPVNA